MAFKKVIYAVSSHKCNNRKLFDYVAEHQNTDKTLLQFFKRDDKLSNETFVGIPIELMADGTINMMSLMLVQELWDKCQHAQATNTRPQIYFI